MAGKGDAVRAGRAYYELYAETNPLVKGLAKGEALVKAALTKTVAASLAIGASAAAAVAAVVAPVAALKSYADLGTELTNISQRTNTSTSALQSLGYAAKQTGGNLDTIAGVLTAIRDKTVDAARGGEQSQLAFARLGISFLSLSRMKPDDQLRLVADRLMRIPNPALRAAAAVEALGSADVLPTLARLKELEDRAQRLGIALSEADVRGAKAFDESLTDLWEVAKSLSNTLAAKLAPAVKSIVDETTAVVIKMREWLDANGDFLASGEVMWAALKLEWVKGSNYIADVWDETANRVEKSMIGALERVGKANKAVGKALAEALGNPHPKEEGIIGQAIEGWKGVGSDAAGLMGKMLPGWSWDEAKRGVTGIPGAVGRGLAKDLAHPMSVDEQREAAIRANLPPRDAGRLPGQEIEETPQQKRIRELDEDLAKKRAARAQAQADAEEALRKAREHNGKPGENPAGGGKGTPGAGDLTGINGAIFHVKGIGAQDIRTKEGFASVARSILQNQPNPMLIALHQGYQLQNLQYLEQRDQTKVLRGLKTQGKV